MIYNLKIKLKISFFDKIVLKIKGWCLHGASPFFYGEKYEHTTNRNR